MSYQFIVSYSQFPQEHILKSLALASKPQVPKNCPVLGSRTALFFEGLKFCRSAKKCFSRPFFFGDRRKKIFEGLFFGKHLRLCPWSLASSIPVLVLGLRFFCVLGLEPCILHSTSDNNNTATSSLCVLCSRRGIVDCDGCQIQQHL